MKLRVVVSLLAVLFFFGGAVYAQERPTFDVFAGYSYVRERPSSGTSNDFSLNGGSASFAYNFNNWLSGVGDVGAYHNGNILGTKADGTLTTYLFGPRVSYRHFGRLTPFGEVLFGGAHAAANLLPGDSRNAFAMTVGCRCGLQGEQALFDPAAESGLSADTVLRAGNWDAEPEQRPSISRRCVSLLGPS